MRDDEDAETRASIGVFPEENASEVPGYLLLAEALRAEGRRAYALGFVISADGVLAPRWKDDVRAVEECAAAP